MNAPLLTVRGLRVGFQKAEGGYVEAVRGVDLTVAETAVVMGVTEGTVKSTLFDARTRLRQILEVSE